MMCDRVAHPATLEGFGNVFLEAVYYHKPIGSSTDETYRMDIQPKGFQVIEFGDFITDDTVQQAEALLANPARVREMVKRNDAIARCHYSYASLEK